ncbi:uncharacterized protein TNCV_4625041 [Trichonephila clavipes]|nr:uncharacterized protein TNCV_4625041 [Trichonephila clavipes]
MYSESFTTATEMEMARVCSQRMLICDEETCCGARANYGTIRANGPYFKNSPRIHKGENRLTHSSRYLRNYYTYSLENCEIIIKTNNCETAKEALKIKEINRVKISTRLSFTGLTTSYILHGIDTEYTIDDIKSELENYNYAIFDIQRFTKKTESGFKPIKTVKVTQIGCSIPERVPIGFEMIKTTLYYEKPRQCTNCWKFGHLQKFCRSAIKCRICSLNHSVNECKEIQIKNAALVGEGHEANDTDCKRYKEEIEILKIKVQQQISRNEAVENSKGKKKTSYSAKTYNDQTEKIENLEKVSETRNEI